MKDRVEIPVSNPTKMLALLKSARDKHVSDGDTSVLRVLNWLSLESDLAVAADAQEKVEQLKLRLAEAYQQRNIKMKVITQHVRSTRDILSGTFPLEMKKMGQWGFSVFDVRTGVTTEPSTTPLTTAAAKQ